MRLIKQRDDDAAATEAMRGGAIGALKYVTVATFVGGVLQATSPRFAAIKPPQKVKKKKRKKTANVTNITDGVAYH